MDNTELLLSQLYDIYEPLPLSWWQKPWAYVGASIAILVVALGWWLYKRSRRPVKPLTYWEQSLYDLSMLEQNAASRDDALLYHELTDIFKQYAHIRFKQPLLDKTDSELLVELPKLSADGVTLLPSQIGALKLLLEQALFIKFAKMPVAAEKRAKDILMVRDFIQVTRPTPQQKPSQASPEK